MKRKKILVIIVTLLTLIFIAVILLNYFQINPNKFLYYSSQEENYFKDLHKSNRTGLLKFEPADIRIVKKIPYDFITVSKVNDQIKSISQHKKFEKLRKELNFKDYYNDTSFVSIAFHYKNNVLTFGRLKNKIAIIFESYDLIGPGVSIAISNDNGTTYKTYYTGLTNKCYYDIKENDSIPLFVNNTTIQLKVDLVRIIKKSIWVELPKYEIIDKNLLLTLDLKKIMNDSDHDNLTDLTELNLNLNPKNKDSDGDGIQDDIDTNPRFRSLNEDKTCVFEELIEQKNRRKLKRFENSYYIRNDNNSKHLDYKHLKIKFTELIVTDNKTFQSINPSENRIIIMTTEEFKKYKLKYPMVDRIENVEIFRCDFWFNAYKVYKSNSNSSEEYIIKRTWNGWKFILESMTIDN